MPSVEKVLIRKVGRAGDRIRKEDLIPRKYRIVNARELGAFLEVQEVVIRAYKEADIIDYAKNADGDTVAFKYDLYDCTQRIFRHERGNRHSIKGSVAHVHGQMELAKLHSQKAKTERELIQNQIFFSTLFRKEDVIKEWSDMVLAIRSKLMSFAWQVAHKVLGKENFQEVVTILNDEMERCTDDLAELDEHKIDLIMAHDKKMSLVRKALKEGKDLKGHPVPASTNYQT